MPKTLHIYMCVCILEFALVVFFFFVCKCVCVIFFFRKYQLPGMPITLEKNHVMTGHKHAKQFEDMVVGIFHYEWSLDFV